MYDSRPGRAQGAFRSDRYPILVPSAHRSYEASGRLYARFRGNLAGSFPISVLYHVVEDVDGRDLEPGLIRLAV